MLQDLFERVVVTAFVMGMRFAVVMHVLGVYVEHQDHQADLANLCSAGLRLSVSQNPQSCRQDSPIASLEELHGAAIREFSRPGDIWPRH